VNATARVGCSGWDYRHWRGPVYPPALARRRWFDHYTSLFDTVELNATFYRLPSAATIEHWAGQAPAGFTYAAKLGSYGSHRRKLREPEVWLGNHVQRLAGLGPAAGPTLVQLPPRWRRDTSRLEDLLATAATMAPASRWAVELRDPSWLHDETYEVLARHQAALCVHDLLAGHPWERTAPWTYVRFHGPRALEHPYQGRYGAPALAGPAERLAAWLAGGSDVYAYFNNDDSGHAVADARWLASALDPT